MRKKRFQNLVEADGEGTWAISYGDMVTLLLTFFIVFFSADKFTQQKREKFNFLEQSKVQDQMSKDLIAGVFPDQEIKEKLQGKVYKQGQKIFIEFLGLSFFNSAKTEIRTEAKKVLNNFYNSYLPYMSRYNIAVRAFADPRPLKPKTQARYKDNLELSTLRSLEVVRFFEKQGIPLDKIRIQGYGELLLTESDLEKISNEDFVRKPSSIYDLARTIVIIIEPKEEL